MAVFSRKVAVGTAFQASMKLCQTAGSGIQRMGKTNSWPNGLSAVLNMKARGIRAVTEIKISARWVNVRPRVWRTDWRASRRGAPLRSSAWAGDFVVGEAGEVLTAFLLHSRPSGARGRTAPA